MVRLRRHGRTVLWAAALAGLTGCLSPVALDKAAMAYNQATADILAKQLLLNIARARHNEPIHFSGISNIAATFSFQANAGATPALTGESGSTILPMFGIAASESPTVSIVPMEGEEFTRRMLTPLSENKMTLLLRQNIDVDLLLRLVAQEFRFRDRGEEFVFHNRPRETRDYERFRRLVLHLSSIQDRGHMFAEPLIFERRWTVPADSVTADDFRDLEQTYAIENDQDKRQYRLTKRITGRILITNYDPNWLSNEERIRLNDEVEQDSPNDLEIDIRPGFPGGEYPIHGRFRLRSFNNILSFVGKTIAEEPEHDVRKDPRTPEVSENPVSTLRILETGSSPSAEDVGMEYRGQYYSVQPDQGYPWNKTAFRLLAQIFQMTVSEVPRLGVPTITIAK